MVGGGSVKKWRESFERECHVMWKRSKKWNGDGASFAGTMPRMNHRQKRLPRLQETWMFLMQVSSALRHPELLNLQFPLHNSSSFSGICLVEPPVQFTDPCPFQ